MKKQFIHRSFSIGGANLYNELVRCYNRSRRKLQRLVTEGKNLRRQDILQRRIVRLFKTLTGLQRALKLGMATAALSAGMLLFQPNAAQAQTITFGAAQTNPFGLTDGFSSAFADLDADGDMDLIALTYGEGDFAYFQNTGTAAAPAYAAAEINPFGLAYNWDMWDLDVADLDGDGDLDLMLGGYFDFYYYQNTGTGAAPAFAVPILNPYGVSPSPSGNALSPTFADLDGDGDLDLLTGETYGWLRYFQNTGTYTTPAFASPIKEPFGLYHYPAYWTNPEFVDLDGDGDFDLMYSFHPNSLRYCENTGTKFAPDFLPFVANPFGLPGGYNPVFADLDGDGDEDLMDSGFGFVYYENTTITLSCTVPVDESTTNITGTSAKLNWDAVASAMGYKIVYEMASSSGSAKTTFEKSGSKEISNLKPNTLYSWQVKSVCSLDPKVTSGWSAKQFFTTGTLRMGDEQTTTLELYPNPTAENFTLDLRINSATDQSATIYLLNALGQIVYSSKEIIGNGELSEELLTEKKVITMPSTASAGWYVVRVVMNDQVMEKKLMYQR